MTLTIDPKDTNMPNEPIGAVEEAARIVARQAGLSRQDVQVERPQWAEILNAGLQVIPFVGRNTFAVTLAAEDVFGITWHTEVERRAVERTLNLGEVYTLPETERRKAGALGSRYRKLAERFAQPTQWGLFVPLGQGECGACKARHLDSLEAHYREAAEAEIESGAEVRWHADRIEDLDAIISGTPEDQLPNLDSFGKDRGWWFREYLAKAHAIEAEYAELAQHIFDNWDDLMDEMRQEYRAIGTAAYRRMLQDNRPNLGTEAEEVDAFVERRMSAIEHKQAEVKASFRMSFKAKMIPLAQEMAADQIAAEHILSQRSHLQAKRTAMLEVERELARTRKEELQDGIVTFVNDVRAYTNGLVLGVANGVLEAIHNNGEVPGASAKALRNLIEKMQVMAVAPDEQIERQMAEIAKLVDNGESLNADVAQVRSVMKRLGAEAKIALLELGRTPSSTRDVGIPDSLPALQRIVGQTTRDSGARTLSLDLAPPALDVSRNGDSRDLAL